jgi:ATP-dependent Zn protease
MYGMSGDRVARVLPVSHRDASVSDTDVESTNSEIREILSSELKKAKELVALNRPLLNDLSSKLINQGEITGKEFVRIAKKHGVKCRVENEKYLIIPNYSELIDSHRE